MIRKLVLVILVSFLYSSCTPTTLYTTEYEMPLSQVGYYCYLNNVTIGMESNRLNVTISKMPFHTKSNNLLFTYELDKNKRWYINSISTTNYQEQHTYYHFRVQDDSLRCRSKKIMKNLTNELFVVNSLGVVEKIRIAKDYIVLGHIEDILQIVFPPIIYPTAGRYTTKDEPPRFMTIEEFKNAVFCPNKSKYQTIFSPKLDMEMTSDTTLVLSVPNTDQKDIFYLN